jgi:hypothetical protein
MMTGTQRDRLGDKEAPATSAARFANAIGHQGLERYLQHSMVKIASRGGWMCRVARWQPLAGRLTLVSRASGNRVVVCGHRRLKVRGEERAPPGRVGMGVLAALLETVQ